jgi:adenine-specific DNA methylase
MWENDDIVPRPDDVYQEKLYCIRWVETYYVMKKDKKVVAFSKDGAEALPNFQELLESGKLKEKNRRHYRTPTQEDIEREKKALALLQERFQDWQNKGYIPSRKIEPGPKTDEPIRTRGWTHWHHLFNHRQLLTNGLFLKL